MIICERCGKKMNMRPNVVTSSIPPYHIYDCPNCGHVQYDTRYDEESGKQISNPKSKVVSLNANNDEGEWIELRRELAVFSFKRLMSDENFPTPKHAAKEAVEYADEMIKRLRAHGTVTVSLLSVPQNEINVEAVTNVSSKQTKTI